MRHSKCARSQFQAHKLQVIAIGWSEISNGLEIYNPTTKQLYISTVFKIDELIYTKLIVNLPYDGGIFQGSLSVDPTAHTPTILPIGTSIAIPSDNTTCKGFNT